MRKLLFLITLLCLLFISGCEVPPTESYISNIKESKYVVTWDEDLSSTLYYVNVTSDVSSSVTFTTTDASYDLSSYIDGLLIKNDKFTLTVKVKSNSTTSFYKEEITITVEKELPTLPIAPTPTNVKIENNILTWDNMNNVNTYEVTITLNDLVESYIVSTNSFDFTSYLSVSGTYYFQVKSLTSDSYSNDSEYCKVVAYEYEEIVIEKEIFNYNFLTMESLPTGFSATSFAKYADKSVKFNSSGFYLTTNSFKALKSFSVTATIKGNGCSGDATITFYGLDDSNKIIETYPITYAITNSKHDITAEFNNTSITKIKLEYTTKATGNFGLYNLSANHDEESDRITSISLEEYQTSYLQNQPFDYSGNLIVNYKSGAVKKHKLNDVKDQLTISQFSTTSKGTYTSVLSYEGFKTNFTYNVKYDYDAYYTYADDIKIYTFDLNDTADNLFVMLSITQDEETINVLFDYNKKTTIDIINTLLLEVSSYTSNKVDYAYSVNNASLFSDSKPLNNTTQYNFAPDVYVTVNNNEFNIDVYGFNYYFTLDTITKTNKVDILHVNSDIDIDTLKVVDPTNVILQEGTINDLVENGMAVYSYNNQIYQYAPTLSNSFFYTFTKNTYTIDGNNLLELSSNTAWSDAQTNGLHHKDLNNYVYRISYYGDISNLYGNELLNSIKNTITKTHTTLVNYAYAKTAYKLTDADPLKPGNIITFYSNTSINGTWENGITWNREHVWPKSLSGGIYNTLDDSDKNAGTDLHHIRPALTSINSSRGNKAYGTITNEQTFYPGDEFIGDTARILFYLSVRYDMSITGLKVCNDISLLLEWNNTDQVDNLERNRNASVQEIQGNFNPFIDNPWIADRIWQ